MRLQNVFAILLLAAIVGLLFVAALGMASAMPAQDLAQYWAAAHLARQNPYSFQAVEQFESANGVSTIVPPMVLRTPPWAVVLVLPLGLLNYQTSYAVWAVLSIVAVAGCARAAWNLVHASPSLAPAFLSLIFGPTLCLLMLGQIAVLVLVGITLFLTMVERKQDWIAGASLLLVLLKPHIAVLFLLAIALWAIRCRRWAIIVSGLCAIAATSIAAVALNPHIFSQYLQFVRQFVQETTPYPNIGGLLYGTTGRHSLAWLPQLLGLLWLAFYWRRHAAAWDWKTHGMVVLLVSLACSYYSFPFDQIIVLPALMAAFANGNRRIFLAGFVLTNLGYAVYLSKIAGHYGFDYMFLWWTASAWMITYLLSRQPRLRLAPAAGAPAASS